MKFNKVIPRPLTFIILSIIFYTSQAQEKKEEFHRYFGIGLSTPVFEIHGLSEDVIPSKKILFGIDPIEYLRLEFHFGLNKDEQQKDITFYPSGKNFSLNLKENAKLYGGGIFGVYPKNKFKFIAGMRLSRNNYDSDEIDYTEGDPMVVTNHGKMNMLTGVLGAEYYFSKWFSLGTELSLMQMKNRQYSSISSTQVTTSQKGVFECGLAFTFYPF